MNSIHYTASLRIKHPTMTGAQITDTFLRGEENPDLMRAFGESIFREDVPTMTGTLWVATVIPWTSDEHVTLEEALLDLTAKLAKRRNVLNSIQETGGSIEYFIGWSTSEKRSAVASDELQFGPVLTEQMNDLNIDCHIDMFFGRDDEE